MPNMIDEIWKILTTLTDEAQNTAREKCQELKFDPNRGMISLEESFMNLSADRAILIDAIEKKKLIQLPITIQKNLMANLESISKSLTNLINGTDEVLNLVNSIEQLHFMIWQYSFHNLSEEVLGYQAKMNQLKNQELELKKLKNEVENGLKLKAELNKFLEKVKKSTETIQASVSVAEENTKKTSFNLNQTTEISQKTTEILSAVQQTNKGVEETSAAITTSKDKVDVWTKEIKKIADTSIEVNKNSNELEKRLNTLIKNAEDNYKRVEDLLPGATSAGLATAYKQRKEKIDKSKKYWVIGFIFSLLGLLFMVIWMIKIFPEHGGNVEWWMFFLQRAPLSFPLIWLGWFFGRNYGHLVRLEEDYAFKESISRSFEGYKKQMQEVDPSGALTQLCGNTISILSEPPLRVFDRKTTDETPANSFFERFVPKRKDTQKN